MDLKGRRSERKELLTRRLQAADGCFQRFKEDATSADRAPALLRSSSIILGV